jgi:hypothetical protein
MKHLVTASVIAVGALAFGAASRGRAFSGGFMTSPLEPAASKFFLVSSQENIGPKLKQRCFPAVSLNWMPCSVAE